MDLFNRRKIEELRADLHLSENRRYDAQANIEKNIALARKEERLAVLIETQERLNNLYSELMSYKFKSKK